MLGHGNQTTPRFNLSKQGIFLSAAAMLRSDALFVCIADRADYGGVRIVVLAPMGVVLWFVAFVDLEAGRLITGLHRVNLREVNGDSKAIQQDQAKDADTPGRSADASGSRI